jgi:hypothetical protein
MCQCGAAPLLECVRPCLEEGASSHKNDDAAASGREAAADESVPDEKRKEDRQPKA